MKEDEVLKVAEKKELKTYTLEEVTKELKVSRQWLMRKIKEGKIKSVPLGGRHRINSIEMEKIKMEGVAK